MTQLAPVKVIDGLGRFDRRHQLPSMIVEALLTDEELQGISIRGQGWDSGDAIRIRSNDNHKLYRSVKIINGCVDMAAIRAKIAELRPVMAEQAKAAREAGAIWQQTQEKRKAFETELGLSDWGYGGPLPTYINYHADGTFKLDIQQISEPHLRRIMEVVRELRAP